MDEKLLEMIAQKSLLLAGKASRGSWQKCSCGKCGLVWSTETDTCVVHAVGPDDQELPIEEGQRQANMDFIAFARLALPLLATAYMKTRLGELELKIHPSPKKVNG